MAGSRAAIRYAKAVLELAQDQNKVDLVKNDMTLIASTISQNKELAFLLENPMVQSSDKLSVLKEVFSSIDTISSNLLGVLVANKRIALLSKVATQYSVLEDALQQREHAVVTTAVALDAALEAKVLAKVQELTTAKQVVMENKIDPSIIGGFILRVGDLQYNASVASQLGKLKRAFSNN